MCDQISTRFLLFLSNSRISCKLKSMLRSVNQKAYNHPINYNQLQVSATPTTGLCSRIWYRYSNFGIVWHLWKITRKLNHSCWISFLLWAHDSRNGQSKQTISKQVIEIHHVKTHQASCALPEMHQKYAGLKTCLFWKNVKYLRMRVSTSSRVLFLLSNGGSLNLLWIL